MATVEVSQGSVDALRRVLSYLVTERQHLRSNGAPPIELEANRKAIVAMQMHLGRALGKRYGSGEFDEKRPPPDQPEAAALRPSTVSERPATPEWGS
jgi:hypothetical protein